METDTKRIRTIAEYAVLSAPAVVSIVVAILDLVGLLDASNWLAQRIPALTLIAIGLVASYLILERRGTLDRIVTSLEQRDQEILQAVTSSSSRVIRGLQGVEVRTFDDGADFVSYFTERVRQARRIDDITWGKPIPAPSSARAREAFDNIRQTVCDIASKPDVVWREVVMFTRKSRFENIKTLLFDNVPGYAVAYYDVPPKEAPPRITFAIIDKEEVLFAGDDLHMAVRHPDVVEFFSQYYEDIWKAGKPLKLHGQVDRDAVNRLEQSLQ